MKTIGRKKTNNERAFILALSLLFTFAFLSFTANTNLAQIKKKKQSSAAKIETTDDSFTSCLPKDVKPDEIVSFSPDAKNQTTVKDELVRLKATCVNKDTGRMTKCLNKLLVDESGKEIRFFRPSCWGNPPADYQEILERERKDLEYLKTKYTVIVFKCNPLIP